MAVLLGLAVVLGWDNSVLEFLFSLFLFLSLFLFQSQMYFWKLNSMSNLLYKGLSAAVCFLLSFTLIRQASKWCEKHFSLLLQLMQMCCLGTKRSSSPERNILRWSPWQKGGLCSALQSTEKEHSNGEDPVHSCSLKHFSYESVKMFSAQPELIGMQLNSWGFWSLIKIELKGIFWERSWRFERKVNIIVIAVLFLEEKIHSFC